MSAVIVIRDQVKAAMDNHGMSRRLKGFSLIELLIVIAIIGILAAVLIPNLLSSRNRANDTAAQAYLREAVTMQEIEQIDEGEYTSTKADLIVHGLREEPDTLTFTIDAATATYHCMSVKHSGGAGTTFYATPNEGINDEECAPDPADAG